MQHLNISARNVNCLMKINNIFEYRLAQCRNIFYCSIRKLVGLKRFYRNCYYGQHINNYAETNSYIYNKLQQNEPFLAARFGDAELRALVMAIENKNNIRKGFSDHLKHVMHLNAGFFPPSDENLIKFGETIYEAATNVDLWGVWFNYMEDYIIKKTSPNAALSRLEGLEPYRVDNPWSSALRGKKVLVVHPFAASINKQYSIREKLFVNPNVLPDFTLLTYKTVQSNGGGECQYDNWFEALDKMFEDIKKIDFDVAIVGCGAYGLPLASRIKNLNKKVIHLAGATQMLFGIRGARWDVRPELQYLFNEFWVRPDNTEKPKNASAVEGACYW